MINEIEEITSPKKVSKNRVWEIDALRGLLILFVVFDHLMFDWAEIFNFSSDFMNTVQELAKYYRTQSAINKATHSSFIVLFLFISGISSSFTRNDLWRSIQLAIFAISLTIVTLILSNLLDNKGIEIRFGILHCLAACMLIGWALTKLKTPNFVIAILALIILVIGATYRVSPMILTEQTKGLYFIAKNNMTASMSPGDFQPLLPALGWYLFGMIFGRLHYKEKVSLVKADISKYFAPLSYIGRHTLFIYLGSQILIFILLYLVQLIGW